MMAAAAISWRGMSGPNSPHRRERFATYPTHLKRALTSGSAGKKYDRSVQMNPSYLEGDFNGDGNTDVAVSIKERASGKLGIAIVHGATGKVPILGAALALVTVAMISNGWIPGRFTPRRLPPTP